MSLVRRVSLGAAQLTLSNVIVRLLALVAMPVLTRLLDPSAYGTAAIATTLISLISVLALAGADVSYIRAYHAEKPPSGQPVEALTWRYAIGASILAAILSVACWRFISGALALPNYAGPLVGAGVIASVCMAMALARARLRDRHRAMSVATVASGFGATGIALAVAYLGPRDELPLILSGIAVYLIPVLVLGTPPLASLLKSPGLSLSESKHILGIGMAVIVTSPAYWVMSSSDRWFLDYFKDPATVGIYSISYSVAIVGMTFNSAVLTIWTPEASRLFEARPSDTQPELGRITEGMIAVLAWVWLAVTAAGGDTVRLLTAPPFHSGTIIIPYIAAAVFLHGIMHLSNTVYLLEKRVHHTIIWWVGGAALCFVLNLLLVPRIGIMGAGLSQLFAFAITALGLSIGARRMLFPHINKTRLALVIATVLAAAYFMVPAWGEAPLVSLLLKLPAGLLVTLIIINYFGTTNVINTVLKRGIA
ncbi:MAG: lipopolysaccharide biosynthesis protein [Rhodomicrobium sp.]